MDLAVSSIFFDVRIVPADQVELVEPPLLAVLVEELRVVTASFLSSELRTAARRFDPKRDLFLALHEGTRTAGALVMIHTENTPQDTGEILLWAVAPGHRGHGCGGELIRMATRHAVSKGLGFLRARALAVSPWAIRLLWQNGFSVCGLAALPSPKGPRELVVLEKRLPAGAAAPC